MLGIDFQHKLIIRTQWDKDGTLFLCQNGRLIAHADHPNQLPIFYP